MTDGGAPFEQLLQLQEHDSRLRQLRHRRATLAERQQLAESQAALAAAEAEVVAAAAERDEAARRQRRLDDEVATIAEKERKVNDTLYGGSVSSPGALQDLQRELDNIGTRRRAIEDDLLEAMEEAEARGAELAEREATRDARAEARAAAEQRLVVAEAEVDAELADVEGQRADIAAGVDDDLVALYDDVRAKGIDPAVARLVGSTCGGCHLTLPATELDRIRHQPPDAVVRCDQCGCILVRAVPPASDGSHHPGD